MKKKRIPHQNVVLALLAFAAWASMSGSAHAKSDKPNIVSSGADDIGWYNISAYNLGVMGVQNDPPSTALRNKARSLQIGTGSRVARLAEPAS